MQNHPSTAVDPTLGNAAAPSRRSRSFAASRCRSGSSSRWSSASSLGWAFPEAARSDHGGWAATDLNVLSSVFLRMIKSLIVPLLFATLVVGIAGHGDDMKRVGRLAFRSIIYFEIVTTLALAVGLLAVNS